VAVVEVSITFKDGQYIASQDPVVLSKTKGDTIQWQNETKEKIRITFVDGTPFPGSRNPYEINPGRQVNSGNIEVEEGTNWAYAIVAESGAMADPQVIIQR